MYKKLQEIASNAYAPYSNFRVCAVFEKQNGEIFYGFNIENVAYPDSMCAERTGLFSAIVNNVLLDDVKTIHIFSPDSKDYLSPCGSCRQTLSEHINEDVEIKMYNKDGKYISKKFKQIFPAAISKENIKGVN